MQHDLTSTILRAADRVSSGRDESVWVIERFPNHFNAFSADLARAVINAEQAKLVIKISR